MTKVDENIQTAQNMLSWIIERCYELEEENKKLKEEVKKWKMVADENGTHYDMLDEEYKKMKDNIDWYEKEEDRLREENRKLKEANEMIKKQLSDEQLYNKLCEIDNRCWSDSEARHVEADELLIECLRTLWFNKAMDKYKWMEFRYS